MIVWVASSRCHPPCWRDFQFTILAKKDKMFKSLDLGWSNLYKNKKNRFMEKIPIVTIPKQELIYCLLALS